MYTIIWNTHTHTQWRTWLNDAVPSNAVLCWTRPWTFSDNPFLRPLVLYYACVWNMSGCVKLACSPFDVPHSFVPPDASVLLSCRYRWYEAYTCLCRYVILCGQETIEPFLAGTTMNEELKNIRLIQCMSINSFDNIFLLRVSSQSWFQSLTRQKVFSGLCKKHTLLLWIPLNLYKGTSFKSLIKVAQGCWSDRPYTHHKRWKGSTSGIMQFIFTSHSPTPFLLLLHPSFQLRRNRHLGVLLWRENQL